jgi:hypothetical protein
MIVKLSRSFGSKRRPFFSYHPIGSYQCITYSTQDGGVSIHHALLLLAGPFEMQQKNKNEIDDQLKWKGERLNERTFNSNPRMIQFGLPAVEQPRT